MAKFENSVFVKDDLIVKGDVIADGFTADNSGNVTIGKDLEVDGIVKVDSKESLCDKDGNPLDFGGGGSSEKYLSSFEAWSSSKKISLSVSFITDESIVSKTNAEIIRLLGVYLNTNKIAIASGNCIYTVNSVDYYLIIRNVYMSSGGTFYAGAASTDFAQIVGITLDDSFLTSNITKKTSVLIN